MNGFFDIFFRGTQDQLLLAFLRNSVPTARRMFGREAGLDTVAAYEAATGRRVAGTAAVPTLASARQMHNESVSAYQFAMARLQEAFARAVAAREVDVSVARFTTLGPGGQMQGLGALPAYLIVCIVAAVFGSLSVIFGTYLTQRDDVIRAVGDKEAKARLVDGFLAQADAYMKANPAAEPPTMDFPASSSASSWTDRLGGLLVIGGGLLVLSMLAKGGAK